MSKCSGNIDAISVAAGAPSAMPDAAVGRAEPAQVGSIPRYLEQTYWWAYVHPRAVRFFERQWLVNLILWGNFKRLRDAALDALGRKIRGRTLQIACVYGDFTASLLNRMEAESSLDVVDVLPIQLRNLRAKLPASAQPNLHLYDSAALGFQDGAYDQAVLFFLDNDFVTGVCLPVDGGRTIFAQCENEPGWRRGR